MEWDVLVVDEAHEGVDTYRTDVAFDHIKRKFTIHLSGTPFKAIANNKFPNEAIYNWTYADEQGAKEAWDDTKGENPYANLPKLNMFTYQMSEIIKEELKQGVEINGETEEYAFDLNEFFKTNNGRFVYNASVDRFLDALTLQKKYPFSTPELRNELKHTFWILERVESARALARKLNDHPVFKDYKVILAAGDGKIDDTDETRKSFDKVIDAIAHNDKTITLSVGQLTVGVTIPEWSGVLILSNIKSPALYMQAAFRAQNPCLYKVGTNHMRKENAYVFDFDPARTLTTYEAFANDLSPNTASGKGDLETRKKNIRSLLNFFPVIGEDEDGELVELDADLIAYLLQDRGSTSLSQFLDVYGSRFLENIILEKLNNCYDVITALGRVLGFENDMEEAKELLFRVQEDASGFTEGQFAEYLIEHEDAIETIKDLTGKAIEHLDDVPSVLGFVIEHASKAWTAGKIIGYVVELCDSTTGKITKAIPGAHAVETYVYGINNRFIGYKAYYRSSITTVEIPSNTTTIGPYAFYDCFNLENLTMPESIVLIGDNAFNSCYLMPSVDLSLVRYIGENAFLACKAIDELVISDDIVKMGSGCFAGLTSLRTLTIPVECICERDPFMFKSITGYELSTRSVEELHITKGKTGIMPDDNYIGHTIYGYMSFSIRSVIIEEGVQNIGDYAFYISTLVPQEFEIVLPSTVTKIGSYAFGGQHNWKNGTFVFPETVTEIGSYCFEKSDLEEITIPESLTTVGYCAFLNSQRLKKLTITSDTNIFGNSCFAGLTGLKELTMPVELFGLNNVFTYPEFIRTDYWGYTFYTNNVELLHLTCGKTGVMPDFVKTDKYTIWQLSKNRLKKVVLDEGITNISDYAFYSDSGTMLSDVEFEIVIPDSVAYIGEQAFSGAHRWKEGKVIIPDTVIEIGEGCFRESDMTEVTISAGMTKIPTSAFSGCRSLTDVVVPEGIRTIGECAFYECTSLKRINLPNSLKVIDRYAFYKCSGINELVISEQIEEVNEYCFAGMTGLKKLTIPNEFATQNNIFLYESGSIYNLGGLTRIETNRVEELYITHGKTGIMADGNIEVAKISRATLGKVVLEEGIQNIGADAFYVDNGYVSVRPVFEISIPDSVTRIGDRAFAGYHGWKDGKVIIPDTVIEIGDSCFRESDMTEVQISSGMSVITAGAFSDCRNLTDVYIPGSINEIEICAFSGCKGIHELVLPDSVININSRAFENTNLTIVANCTSYSSEWALANNRKLKMIHDIINPSYEWSENFHACTATAECARDGSHQDMETVTTVEEIIVAPTCNDSGLSNYSATFSNPQYTEQTMENIVTLALGHDWGSVNYDWTNDNNEVTATRICSRDEEHIETETVDTTSEVTRNATCEEAGETTYTAVFENNAFEEQVKKDDNIPALGHVWDEPEYIWTDDNSQVTAVHICMRNTEHKETETVDTSSTVMEEATCEDKGKTKYTAVFENAAFDAQSKIIDDIMPTGHRLTEHTRVEPTCIETGTEAYWICNICESMFSDENCENRIDEPVILSINENNHKWKKPVYTWTCDKKYVIAERICEYDPLHVEYEKAIAEHKIKSPTDTADGKAVYTVMFANEAFGTEGVLIRTIDIPALNKMSILTLPDALTVINKEAFANLACDAIIVPNGCIMIDDNAFARCTKLLYISIPMGIMDNVPESAFDGCHEDLVIDWR